MQAAHTCTHASCTHMRRIIPIRLRIILKLHTHASCTHMQAAHTCKLYASGYPHTCNNTSCTHPVACTHAATQAARDTCKRTSCSHLKCCFFLHIFGLACSCDSVSNLLTPSSCFRQSITNNQINQSNNQPTNQSKTNQSTNQSKINQSINQSTKQHSGK